MRFKVNETAPKEILGRKPDENGEISLTKKQAEYYLRQGHISEADSGEAQDRSPAPAADFNALSVGTAPAVPQSIDAMDSKAKATNGKRS